MDMPNIANVNMAVISPMNMNAMNGSGMKKEQSMEIDYNMIIDDGKVDEKPMANVMYGLDSTQMNKPKDFDNHLRYPFCTH